MTHITLTVNFIDRLLVMIIEYVQHYPVIDNYHMKQTI